MGSTRNFPTLKGIDNLVRWRRGLELSLLCEDALQVLSGVEVEPFRATLLPRIAARDGRYASDIPPGAAVATFAATSITSNDLTREQRAEWEKWSVKERKARSLILLSISSALAGDYECLWSAHDIYKRILAEHRLDSPHRQRDLTGRLQRLQLPEKASKEQMLAHYDAFILITSELRHAGKELSESKKCEIFLDSLFCYFDDVTSTFSIYEAKLDTSSTWTELSSNYKMFADRKGRMEDFLSRR
jgi:hypothetical protein